MFTETIEILPASLGALHTLTVFRFGVSGARPKVYIQAALHADEIPGMIAAHYLCQKLEAMETDGKIAGEIVLVPMANPIGQSQTMLGAHIGRFSFDDGANFNRHYPDLSGAVADAVGGRLGAEESENVALIRQALIAAVAELAPTTPSERLKKILLGLAIDSDAVLDLHCDSEAAVHLYTLTPHAERCEPLYRALGCEAVLLATDSGDNPFDEATSTPWLLLRQHFPGKAIPLPCMAVTVELRGQRDVSEETGMADADALVQYLIHEGAIHGEKLPLPEARCRPTPLAGVEPLVAPCDGVILFDKPAGCMVTAGDRIARIVNPVSGEVQEVHALSSGQMFARTASRFALAGKRLGKIAGETINRSGKLLSP